MTLSPSPAARAARQAIAKRLCEIREDAGLTGRALAERTGWHPSKISKLEHGVRPPTVTDASTWCEACGAADHLPDLLAAIRTAESMYLEYRPRLRAGLRRIQEDGQALFEKTRNFRIYEQVVIPGILQTPAYAEAMMRRIIDFHGIPDDAEAAVTRFSS